MSIPPPLGILGEFQRPLEEDNMEPWHYLTGRLRGVLDVDADQRKPMTPWEMRWLSVALGAQQAL